MKRKLIAALVGAALLVGLTSATGEAKAPVKKKATAVITQTVESYGSDPLQIVTLRRNLALNTTPTKTVIFLHGGGWNSGGRGSLEAEAIEWAKTGWVSINVSYRTAVYDGIREDGRDILADVLDVLATYRVKSYVDPTKIIVYGESAGGHLATWLGAYKGAQIAGTVAISPVSSISNAILAGQAEGATSQVQYLGNRADEFFGYSVGTTQARRYVDRAKNMLLIFATREWVDPDIHSRVLCVELGAKCSVIEVDSDLHAGNLIDEYPELARSARHWAGFEIT